MPKYLIAGPCSVESEEQIYTIAKAVKAAGASHLRGGAFKPRTSPYTFQGLGVQGLALLAKAGKSAGLPTVSEITDPRDVDKFCDIDILQIGSRNMQNFALLKEVGKSGKPVLLKRGFAATTEEFLFAAEHIIAAGGKKVILCERGIRSFSADTRFLLDISAIPVIKSRSELDLIVDPSHAAGQWQYVKPLALAAIAAGCDGLEVEVHNQPEKAISDGEQSLSLKNFEDLAKAVCSAEPFAYKY